VDSHFYISFFIVEKYKYKKMAIRPSHSIVGMDVGAIYWDILILRIAAPVIFQAQL
jgi:hypothetical protein